MTGESQSFLMLTDEQLLNLYKDKTFPGAYSGIRAFQTFLKTQLNENISLQRIQQLLTKQPFYVVSQRPIRKFPRRKFDVGGYGFVLQADLAQLYEKNGFKYFLTVVDVFSQKIWAEPLKTKQTREVKQAFEKIFHDANTDITKLETDQGTEFTGLKDFFKQNNILFRTKKGKNKASWAEHAIFLIKRKLFLLLRSETSDDWVANLPHVVSLLNKRHIQSLGNVPPEEIRSELDDVKIRSALAAEGKPIITTPNWKQQNLNQEKYEKSKNPFQVGQFVYVDKKVETFDKSYYSQVSIFSNLLIAKTRDAAFHFDRKFPSLRFPYIYYVVLCILSQLLFEFYRREAKSIGSRRSTLWWSPFYIPSKT